MAIDKVGSIDTAYIYARVPPQRQDPAPEKTEDISVAKQGEIKNLTKIKVPPVDITEEAKDLAKIKDPPFLPIGDTWSIFKEE